MSDTNNFNLIGRLCDDMKLSYFQSGMAFGEFTIANNRTKKTANGFENDTSFFECQLFGKIAESLKQYMTKGKRVSVAGAIKQKRWTKDGRNFSKIVFFVEKIQILDSVQGEGQKKFQNHQQNGQANAGYQQKQNQPQNDYVPSDYDFPEDIPF